MVLAIYCAIRQMTACFTVTHGILPKTRQGRRPSKSLEFSPMNGAAHNMTLDLAP